MPFLLVPPPPPTHLPLALGVLSCHCPVLQCCMFGDVDPVDRRGGHAPAWNYLPYCMHCTQYYYMYVRGAHTGIKGKSGVTSIDRQGNIQRAEKPYVPYIGAVIASYVPLTRTQGSQSFVWTRSRACPDADDTLPGDHPYYFNTVPTTYSKGAMYI